MSLSYKKAVTTKTLHWYQWFCQLLMKNRLYSQEVYTNHARAQKKKYLRRWNTEQLIDTGTGATMSSVQVISPCHPLIRAKRLLEATSSWNSLVDWSSSPGSFFALDIDVKLLFVSHRTVRNDVPCSIVTCTSVWLYAQRLWRSACDSM